VTCSLMISGGLFQENEIPDEPFAIMTKPARCYVTGTAASSQPKDRKSGPTGGEMSPLHYRTGAAETFGNGPLPVRPARPLSPLQSPEDSARLKSLIDRRLRSRAGTELPAFLAAPNLSCCHSPTDCVSRSETNVKSRPRAAGPFCRRRRRPGGLQLRRARPWPGFRR